MRVYKFWEMEPQVKYHRMANGKIDTTNEFFIDGGNLWCNKVGQDALLTDYSLMSVYNMDFVNVTELTLVELDKGITIETNDGTCELTMENSTVNYALWVKDTAPLRLSITDKDNNKVSLGLTFENFNDIVNYVDKLQIIYKQA